MANYCTILYLFCHTSTWIHHVQTRVPHPEPPPPPSPYHPSGSSQCTSPKDPVSNLDWRTVSYMIFYMFPWHSSNCYLCVCLIAHILKNWNNTEKISMTPAQGWHTNLWRLPYFSVTALRRGTGRKVGRRFKSGRT